MRLALGFLAAISMGLAGCDYDWDNETSPELERSLEDLQDASDRAACISMHPSSSPEYYGCLTSRRDERHLREIGERACGSGGRVEYRRICTSRDDYWGHSREECYNVRECIYAGRPSGSFHFAAPTPEEHPVSYLSARPRKTVRQALASLDPLTIALAYRVSQASAARALDVLGKAIEDDPDAALSLGFSKDDLKAIARFDIQGVKPESYDRVARALDMRPVILKGIVARFVLILRG